METYISKSIVVSNFCRFDLLSFRSTVAVPLPQKTKSFSKVKKKASAVFINLTKVYDTVWHCGLTWATETFSRQAYGRMIMKLVRNWSFIIITRDSKENRLRCLESRLVLAFLFNIFTYELLSMITKRFVYTDDPSLWHSSVNWRVLVGTLNRDINTPSAYLQTWWLKLSRTKTVMATFYLNDGEAKNEPKVYNNNRLLPFGRNPSYLEIKLDRTKTILRVSLLRRLINSKWLLIPKHCAQMPYLWSTQHLGTEHQSGVAALGLVLRTVSWITSCALSLDVCVSLQRTTYSYFQASNQLSFSD